MSAVTVGAEVRRVKVTTSPLSTAGIWHTSGDYREKPSLFKSISLVKYGALSLRSPTGTRQTKSAPPSRGPDHSCAKHLEIASGKNIFTQTTAKELTSQ